MKTWKELCSEPSRLVGKSGSEVFRFINEKNFKQIQLDAYKVGMTEAAEIVMNGPSNCESLMCINAELTKQEILSARDKKETI